MYAVNIPESRVSKGGSTDLVVDEHIAHVDVRERFFRSNREPGEPHAAKTYGLLRRRSVSGGGSRHRRTRARKSPIKPDPTTTVEEHSTKNGKKTRRSDALCMRQHHHTFDPARVHATRCSSRCRTITWQKMVIDDVTSVSAIKNVWRVCAANGPNFCSRLCAR